MKPEKRRRAARALAESVVAGDRSAARGAGVTAQTLAAWRKDSEQDAELGAMVVEELGLLDARWREELGQVATDAARILRRLFERTAELIDEVLDHPASHLDENGAAPTTIDQLRMLGVVTDNVRGVLEKSTEILTHYDAVVGRRQIPATGAKDGKLRAV